MAQSQEPSLHWLPEWFSITSLLLWLGAQRCNRGMPSNIQHLPAQRNQPANFKHILITLRQTRSNKQNDPLRLLPNPRRPTQKPTHLPPSHNLPTPNSLDPIRLEPYHRLRSLWWLLRLWCRIPRLSFVWLASGFCHYGCDVWCLAARCEGLV